MARKRAAGSPAVLHDERLDAHGLKRAAEARLELARAEFELADARWRNAVSGTEYGGVIAKAETRVAAAKAAL